MTAPWPTPGTVAMVRRKKGDKEEIALCSEAASHLWWDFASSTSDEVDAVHSARPLVTLDPESLRGHAVEIAQRVGSALDIGDGPVLSAAGIVAVEDYLRALLPDLTPPRPAEPTGLGVRAIDRYEIRWVPDEGDWWPLGTGLSLAPRSWADLLDSRGPVTIEGGESDD